MCTGVCYVVDLGWYSVYWCMLVDLGWYSVYWCMLVDLGWYSVYWCTYVRMLLGMLPYVMLYYVTIGSTVMYTIHIHIYVHMQVHTSKLHHIANNQLCILFAYALIHIVVYRLSSR